MADPLALKIVTVLTLTSTAPATVTAPLSWRTDTFEQCVADAMAVAKPDAAKIMCAQAREISALRPLVRSAQPCPACPPPTPAKVDRRTDLLTILGAVGIGSIIGGLVVGAVWLTIERNR